MLRELVRPVSRLHCVDVMSMPAAAAAPTTRRISSKVSPFYVSLLEDAGREEDGANQQIYLITVSRALPVARAASGCRDLEALMRAELLEMIRDFFDNPVAASVPGRPRARDISIVDAVFVVKMRHGDGSAHFHAAVRLLTKQRFKLAKQTCWGGGGAPVFGRCAGKAARYVQ